MAKTLEELEKLKARRCSTLKKSSMCLVIENQIDPDTGAGVIVSQSRFGDKKLRAHFYRSRQIKSPFKEEPINSNHEQLGVMGRLKDLLAAEKAAKVAPHDLKRGEIIARIWGYTMQDVIFLQVVDVPHPRKVSVVELFSTIISGDSTCGTKIPVVPDTIPSAVGAKTYDVSMETGRPYLKTGDRIDRSTRWDNKPVQHYSS